jgi:carbamoyl-phosphate synthase large subunit
MKRILVLGVGGSAGINFVRSLRLSGEQLYIVGTDINKYHLVLLQDTLDRRYVVPACTDKNYIRVINNIIKDENIEFVHAQPDIEVENLSCCRTIVGAKTFLPKHDTILACRNKFYTYVELNKASVPVPNTYLVDDVSTIPKRFNELAGDNKKVWVRAIMGAGSRASLPVYTPEQLMNWVFYWISNKKMELHQFMMSEFLPGREFAWQSLWKDGHLIIAQARERLEYLMGNLSVSGQTSSPSVARTVNDARVSDIGVRAVRAIDKKASGIFCIDMKEDSSGRPCVTEINAGRFFTTSNFFTRCGVNMPYMYLKLGFGEKVSTGQWPSKFTPIPEDKYWIRLPDALPVLVDENEISGARKPIDCAYFKELKCTYSIPFSDILPPDECVLKYKTCPVFKLR